MQIPFTTDQVLTLLTLFSAGLLAYAEVKYGLRDVRRRLDAGDTVLADLQNKAANAALVEQAVQTIDQSVRNLTAGMSRHQDLIQGLEKSLVRVEALMEAKTRET